MEYIAVYKCSMCDTLIQYGESREVAYDKLPNLCYQVIQNQLFAGNQYLHKVPMQIVHKCKDGSCGLAYFSGFKKVR